MDDRILELSDSSSIVASWRKLENTPVSAPYMMVSVFPLGKDRYARKTISGIWETCQGVLIYNMDLNHMETRDFRYDCDLKSVENGHELWIQSGGSGFEETCEFSIPVWVAIKQHPQPVCYMNSTDEE